MGPHPPARMERSRNLIVRRSDPFNAETAPARLVDSFVTAERDFFVRSHGQTPPLGAEHRVVIDGLVDRPAAWTADQLAQEFPARTVTATVQCAGNRRAHLQQVASTAGDPWDVGAIGTAEWTGVELKDVLAAVGVRDDAAHVAFVAEDLAEGGGTIAPYEVSIPLAKALAPGVLVAWAMNGAALTPDHGYPLRTIVPGHAGVRSVKWLSRIEVRDRPSDAPMHARDYKVFPPDVTAASADWAQGLSIYALPVNSAICDPVDGAAVSAGRVIVRGWAMAYDRAVARVELSRDGGDSWVQAKLARGPGHDAWVLWSAVLDLSPGTHDLVVRAIDDAGQGQPADPAQVWNFKGYVSAAWHRIRVIAG